MCEICVKFRHHVDLTDHTESHWPIRQNHQTALIAVWLLDLTMPVCGVCEYVRTSASWMHLLWKLTSKSIISCHTNPEDCVLKRTFSLCSMPDWSHSNWHQAPSSSILSFIQETGGPTCFLISTIMSIPVPPWPCLRSHAICLLVRSCHCPVFLDHGLILLLTLLHICLNHKVTLPSLSLKVIPLP